MSLKLDYVVIKRRTLQGPLAKLPSGMVVASQGGLESNPPKLMQLEISKQNMTAEEAAELATEEGTDVPPNMPLSLVVPHIAIGDGGEQIPDPLPHLVASGALDCPFDGRNVCVAILDSGIDRNHPAFAGLEIVEKDFTGHGDGDMMGHGTHCAGTIFGRAANGKPRTGVAPGIARALVAKVFHQADTPTDTQTLFDALHWAMSNGADVISMSLGMDFTVYREWLVESKGLHPKAATAVALEGYRRNILAFESFAASTTALAGAVKGCLVIAAAGNASEWPGYRIAAEPPSNTRGWLSVAALQDSEGMALASFSNNGAHFAAPGVGIWSTLPNNGYGPKPGTSMATPQVAGIACLWAQKLRQDKGHAPRPDEVVDALRMSARPLLPGISTMDVLWGRAVAPSGVMG